MTESVNVDAIVASAPRDLYIDGSWCSASDGGHFAVCDPATGGVVSEVADATPEDARRALEAASYSSESWAGTAPRERAELLRRSFEMMQERARELAILTTCEMGKPLGESLGEVAYASEFLRWFSEEACRLDGRFTTAPDGRTRMLVMRRPVGPCLLITPWNFPLAMITRKIGPAVAAGCTVVVKPAEETPLTALALMRVFEDAGMPRGVINMVPTSSPGATIAPLLSDARLRKLSFTGSTAVGAQLLRESANRILRVSLELGGNAPFIVFDDADLDEAADGAMLAKMRNNGEACTAANRFYVHRKIYSQFLELLNTRMRTVRVGGGFEEGVQLGPLVNDETRQKVSGLVEDAVARGATCTTGGIAIDRPGYFFEPTVLVDVPIGARLLHEEIFGPVAAILPFDDDDEVIHRSNESDAGLAAYVYTSNLTRALYVSEQLEAGMVGLNTGLVSNPAAPFGGVKMSGLGREGGHEGIYEYVDTRYVAVA